MLVLLLVACDPTPPKFEDPGPTFPTPTPTACDNSDQCDDGDPCTLEYCQGDVGTCETMEVVCEEPPEPSCTDATTLRTWADVGVCGEGGCEYEPIDTVCELGCSESACAFGLTDALAWVQVVDSTAELYGAYPASTPDGELLLAVQADGPVEVDGTQLEVEPLSTVLVRLAADGQLQWVQPLLASDPGGYYASTLRPTAASDGSIYVAGSAYGTVRLAPGLPGELIVPGELDLERSYGLLAKLDAAGLPQWTVTMDSEGAVEIRDVVAMEDGGAVVYGTHTGEMLLESTLLQAEAESVFLARYSAEGALVWAWDGPVGWSTALETRGGQIFLALGYEDEVQLPDGEPLVPVGDYSVAVIALEGDGSVLWSDTLGGTSPSGFGLAAADDGSVVMVGGYQGELLVSPGTPQEVQLLEAELFGGYAARWDASGTLLWTRVVSTASGQLPYAFAMDVITTHDGGVEMTGFTTADLRLEDGVGVTQVGAVGSPSTDLWYAHYDADGTLLHAAVGGGLGWDDGLELALLEQGPVIVGTAEQQATFGLGEPNETVVNAGQEPVVVVLGLSQVSP